VFQAGTVRAKFYWTDERTSLVTSDSAWLLKATVEPISGCWSDAVATVFMFRNADLYCLYYITYILYNIYIIYIYIFMYFFTLMFRQLFGISEWIMGWQSFKFQPLRTGARVGQRYVRLQEGWCSHTNWIRWKCSASRVGWVEKFGSQLLALGSGDSFGSMHNKHTAYVLQRSFPSIVLAYVSKLFLT